MKEWNVVITVFQGGFKRAIRALRELGPVEPSPYHNVLVMTVTDPLQLLEALEQRTAADPALYDAISRVAPAMRSFDFTTAEEFCNQAKAIGSNGRAFMAAACGSTCMNRTPNVGSMRR